MALGSTEPNALLQKSVLGCACNRTKREVNEKGGRKKQGGNARGEGGGFRSAREEEEEDRCTRFCSTHVETSSVSVEGKRKFARRRAGPAATCVQLSPRYTVEFQKKIRMQLVFISFQHFSFSALAQKTRASLT